MTINAHTCRKQNINAITCSVGIISRVRAARKLYDITVADTRFDVRFARKSFKKRIRRNILSPRLSVVFRVVHTETCYYTCT